MTRLSPVRRAAAVLALSAIAITAQAATAPIYEQANNFLKPSGAPDIVAGRFIPTRDETLIFTQGVDYVRVATLGHDLDLITPEPDRRLPAGTELYLRSDDPAVPKWCTTRSSLRDMVCIYRENGAWVWQQNDTRLPARCLLILPCLLAPPKTDPVLRFPVTEPQIAESPPTASPRFVARVTVRKERPGGLSIYSKCLAPQGPTQNSDCYLRLGTRPDLWRDRVLVGGDNTGALLHYDAANGSITVTRVALDPATGKMAP